jgi:thiamine-phosphate pyrophosphorylase
MRSDYLKLMLLTNKAEVLSNDYAKFIEKCAVAGITSLQLREKNLDDNDLEYFGKVLKAVLQPFNIPLIINDNVDLAKAINAEGVHLGQTDGNPIEARKLLGNDKIIGVSIETKQQLEIANKYTEIDYVAASAVFPSKNKNNIKTLWGLDGLENFVISSSHPVIAIGGIDESNVIQIKLTGIKGVAVIGAIHDSTDLSFAIKKLLQ